MSVSISSLTILFGEKIKIEISWENLMDLWKKKKKILGDDIDEPTHCYFGTEYFLYEMGFSFEKIDEIRSKPELVEEISSIRKDGIYYVHIDTSQMEHYFIMIIENKKVKIISTYGGSEGIFIYNGDYENWIKIFESRDYMRAFHLPADAFPMDEEKVESIEYRSIA